MSGGDRKVKFSAATPTYLDLLEEWRSGARPIVVWAGAGLSAPAGLPSWPTLQNKIAGEASIYINTLSEEQQKDKRFQYKALNSISNPWIAFEKLEKILGEQGFEAAIKRSLNIALKCQVPKIYTELWKLGISGFLTLNIDRLASRAYTEAGISDMLIERNGFDLKPLIGNISTAGGSRFIANLHGVFEDPKTWIFTEEKRKNLFTDKRYVEFVRDVLKYCTVVFIGVSAHDIAIRDHLRKLKNDGIGFRAFWISNEVGNEALQIAEDSGIRFVSYRNTDGSHGELLNIISDIQSFTAIGNDAPPVINQDANPIPISDLPSIPDLLILTPNEQRVILNAHASQILIKDNEESYQKFEEFCGTYNRVIHAAGLFELDNDSNKILDYTLCEIADTDGGFGTIWRAVDAKGNQVAIKVFKHDIRKNQSLLKTFRRGVRSLKILGKHNLPNIIQFETACEIPPVLVMEWIEGANLFTAVSQGSFRSWDSRLRVACDLSTAIYRAHSVPERVLHRDIKPHNIMFKEYYQEGENSELVVLDFDLSWHVGALEKSVLAKGANPYLAPEQLISIAEMTSRSAAVDAFGLGMTLYFLCSGEAPTPFIHQSSNWGDKLERIANQSCKPWQSIPKRMARLIELCTQHDQNMRPSFSQITADLTRMNHIIHGDFSHLDIRLFGEELAARVEALNGYKITPEGVIVWKSQTQRLKTTITPVNSNNLTLKFEFIQIGNEQFNSLENASDQIANSHNYLPTAMRIDSPVFTRQHGHFFNEIRLKVDLENVKSELTQLHKSISTVMDKLMAVAH
jgi:eukaryotic-like serine/threonine-protein kinase